MALGVLTHARLRWVVHERAKPCQAVPTGDTKKLSVSECAGTASAYRSPSTSPSPSKSSSPSTSPSSLSPSGPTRSTQGKTIPASRDEPEAAGPGEILDELTGPDRTAKKLSKCTFVLELCQAFGLSGAAAVAQRKAFGAVWRRLSVLGVSEDVRGELVALASSCPSDVSLDRPVS
jgi:hypothetical protein